MIRIVFQRAKCIGCNACVDAAKYRWRISRKDGKCILIGGREKKGFYTVMAGDDEWEANVKAANQCPVKIIKLEKVVGWKS